MCIYNVSTFISLTFSDFTFQFNMKFIQVKSFFDFLHYTFNIVWFMFIQLLLLVTAILVQMTDHLITYPFSPTPGIGLQHMCMNGNCSLILRKFCEFFTKTALLSY